MTPINILVTIDANYIQPLQVMLKSMFLNNPEEHFRVFLMHSRLAPDHVDGITAFVERNGHTLSEVRIGEECFCDAPVVKHYTKEMYYRLLAFRYLPPELRRILYLDPDILVINPIRSLYDTDLSGWLFAAAYLTSFLPEKSTGSAFRIQHQSLLQFRCLIDEPGDYPGKGQ